ncbi:MULTISPECIES: hypothetical protein [Flagellimonas]|jgi:hypothetical protein|uniref:Uncharacterized protein n=1 Tax=Flagellimonas nanhaiensis TaxID=2292706 RepID=A0A371JMP2_9FLAO|nr:MULTISPECIES: hypothetical protein [Allomuricauda]NNK19241.1 hypothetical protein [Maribacter sp.]NNM18108.1 hypothetical protein [Croceitalea sp.]MCL6266350.1 hypothetical protein [Muricauda myxillae]NNK74599.1 hypothetical protein [Maribacter sp.]RDY58412.1 hypothetical protein DX873_15540 [Allomuricauda nanhaiensis]
MQLAIPLIGGLEYVDTVFQTIKDSDFLQYTIVGMKALAILFFLINVLKKYNEGVANRDGYTWGLTPTELIKNFIIVILVIFSSQVLEVFDSILVAIEGQYRNTAPSLLPLQLQDVEIEDDVSGLEAASKGLALLYEALTTPLYGLKILAFILSVFLWLLDLFIYPLFLAERFFLLGIMQAFFPLVISLAVFEKFRSMAYTFFKLYAAVYMLVPAFFLVNVFVNALYTEFTTNFWVNLFGFDFGSSFFAPIIELGTIGFIVFLKFKLYKRATSFTFKLFSA